MTDATAPRTGLQSVWASPILLLVITTLVWAAHSIVGRLAVGQIGPMTLVTLRWAVALIPIFITARPSLRQDWPALRARWVYLAIMGASGYTAFNALFYVAAHHTSALNLSIIQGAIPALVLLGARLFLGVRFTSLQALGAFITMIGVAVIAAQGDPARLAALAFNSGDVMMVIGAVLYAGYTIGLRQRPNVSQVSMLAAMALARLHHLRSADDLGSDVRRIRLADCARPPGARLCGAWAGLRRAAHFHARGRTDRTGPGRRVRQSGAGVRRHHGGCHLGRAIRPLSCPRALVSCRGHRHRAKKLERPALSEPKEIDMAWIELKPEGAGPIRAWRADPVSAPRGGIVVIQEIFGVNSHIREVTDRFAAEGYLAVAPAIFEHVEPNFETGYDADARTRGMAIAGKIDREQVLRDVAAAIEVAKQGGKVAIVGFCLGGTVAWSAAGRLSGLSAAVGYYGGGIIGLKDLKPKVPTLLHFGEKDQHIPVAGVKEVAAAHPDVEVHIYPADHGFNCDHRESYDAPSAARAWTRTIEFLKKHVG
jgi:carboxymethylenebutenolidase